MVTFKKELPRPAKKGELVSLDLEVFGQDQDRLHRPTGTFACISIAYSDEVYQVYDVPDLKRAIKRISPGMWVAHNMLYDLLQLRRWCKVPQRQVWDTMLVERAMWGGYYNMFDLSALSRRYLGYALNKDIRSQFGEATEMTSKMKEYAAQDARATYDIVAHQQAHLDEIGDDLSCYWDIDELAIWSFADMQPSKIDVKGWLKMVEGFARRGQSIEEDLGINVYSHVQVKAYVKTELGIVVPNTNAKKTMEPLIRDLRMTQQDTTADVIEQILEARTFRKAVSTYGPKWIENGVEEGDLVYAGWKVTGASTGRSACSNPNLQNIPIRKTPEYRNQFISKYENGQLIIADVAQQEPRIAAALSGDEELLGIFRRNEDVYKHGAGIVYGDRRRRKDAKPIVLGSIYGLSPWGLARDTGMTEAEAEEALDKFFMGFMGLSTWITKTRSQAQSFGYVRTASGRLFYINEHKSKWMRNAINSPIQGTGGDQVKMAQNLIHKEAALQDLPYLITLLVHDELVADAPPELIKTYATLLNDAWIEAGKKLVPDVLMVVDIAIGDNWGCK